MILFASIFISLANRFEPDIAVSSLDTKFILAALKFEYITPSFIFLALVCFLDKKPLVVVVASRSVLSFILCMFILSCAFIFMSLLASRFAAIKFISLALAFILLAFNFEPVLYTTPPLKAVSFPFKSKTYSSLLAFISILLLAFRFISPPAFKLAPLMNILLDFRLISLPASKFELAPRVLPSWCEFLYSELV